jgi:hypothetical protein
MIEKGLLKRGKFATKTAQLTTTGEYYGITTTMRLRVRSA